MANRTPNARAEEADTPTEYSIAQVATRLGVDRRTVGRWIARDVFPNAYQKNPLFKTSPFVIPAADLEAFEALRKEKRRGT